MRFILYLTTILALLTAPLSASISQNLKNNSLKGGMILKRDKCTHKDCGPKMHKDHACNCTLNEPEKDVCKVICVEAPAIVRGGGLPDIPAKTCPNQVGNGNVIVGQSIVYQEKDKSLNYRHWDIKRCFDYNAKNTNENEVTFTGTLHKDGSLAMRAGENGAIGRFYVFGLAVGRTTYYFELEGHKSCEATDPAFKYYYEHIKFVRVREKPTDMTKMIGYLTPCPA